MTRHEAEPRAEISTPPVGPVWWRATCTKTPAPEGSTVRAQLGQNGLEFEAPNGTTAVFIKTRTWFDAREQAMLEFQLEAEFLEVRQCGNS